MAFSSKTHARARLPWDGARLGALLAVALAACAAACFLAFGSMSASPASANAAEPAEAAVAADGAIEISTAQQLAALADAVNKGGTSEYPLNGSYRLVADIDLADTPNWTPIGKASRFSDDGGKNSFQGTFDGNGHTVRNLTITSLQVGTGTNNYGGRTIGLFGTTRGATIKNLNLENASITDSAGKRDAGRDLACGALVGLAVDTAFDNCNIRNAVVSSTSTAATGTFNNALGGMVGDLFVSTSNPVKSRITNCSVNQTTVESFSACDGSDKSQPYTGGFVGRWRDQGKKLSSTETYISNCVFDGTVRGNGFVGPFAAGLRIQSAPIDEISPATLNRFNQCFYSERSSFAQTDGSVVSSVYNDLAPEIATDTAKHAYNADGTYANAEKVAGDTVDQALVRLKAEPGAGDRWRIATLDDGTRLLVLDFRSVFVSSAYAKANGQATLSAVYAGCYGEADKSGASFAWKVGSEEKGNAATFALPITNSSQTVTLEATLGATPTTSTCVVEPQQTQWAVAKTTDPAKPSEVAAMTAKLINPDESGFTQDLFTYRWYGVTSDDSGNKTKHGLAGQSTHTDTLVKGDYEGYTSFAVVATCNTGGGFEIELDAGSTTGKIVYVSNTGAAGNDGLKPETPVKTLQQAYRLLDSAEEGGTRENNIIVIMDAYTDTDFGKDGSTFNKPATITSYYEGPVGTLVTLDGEAVAYEDYRSKNNASIQWYGAGNSDSSQASEKLLFAATTFKNITFSVPSDWGQARRIGYIYCQGNSLTMDSGVVMKGYRSSSSGSYGQLSGSASADFNIVGGYANFNVPSGQEYGKTCSIVVRSGSYARIIAGCRSWGVNSQNHNQFGSEESPFNVSITVDIAGANSQMSSSNAGYNSGYRCDVAQLCGGQTDGTIYANSSLTIDNGVVPMVLGSSIGYPRVVGEGYANNDFIGTSSVTVNGGKIMQLFGGCLGRSLDSSMKADSRFLSFSNKSDNSPDIQISITGGFVGKLPNIGSGGADGSLIGVFAAGAGGSTGTGDAAAGTVDNRVDVLLSISGGEIGSADNPAQLFGGGYGYSTGVTAAASANLEAGNLYGSSTVDITGGTIAADVFGGGSGTTAYLKNNKAANALAQIVGDVSLSIGKAAVTGSVYGGSKGFLSTEADVACFDMAKITGNVSLVVKDDATVSGSVYGGSKVGQVTGSVAVDIDHAHVGGSVYGGGEGSLVADSDAGFNEQKAVGWVKGNVSLAVKNAASIGGSVFGGGSLGVVGDGEFTSSALGYSVLQPANVAVFFEDSTVGGSVFGGGEGSASASGQMPRLVGGVFGSTHVTVRSGTIGADVFGGGNQSYLYAPLDGNGQPQQAATVIVNSADSIYVNDADGSVAPAPGEAVRTVDVAPSDQVRSVGLGGSVFGGGNISDEHAISVTNNYTVYGDAEVFIKGAGTSFTNQQRGGVYGDGNLSRVYGTRNVTLVSLKDAGGAAVKKEFFSLQRADRVIVHDSSILLKGAKDLVSQSDTTMYSLNRIQNLNMYAGSTIEFETVVNGLGNLCSDVLSDRVFTEAKSGLELTEYGDNVTEDEKESYRAFCEGKASSWKAAGADGKQQTLSSANTIVVNNGKWLDVKDAADSGSTSYGSVTGLFSLVSSTATDGGAFVFARYEAPGSTGTFVSMNREAEDEDDYLDLYTQRTFDADGAQCRVWFIKGETYVYSRDLKAYTTNTTASIKVWLPVGYVEGKTETSPGDMRLTLDGDIAVADTLANMQKASGESESDYYKVGMTLGESDGSHDASEPLPFYQGSNETWSYDYSKYANDEDVPGLVPATITIDIDPNDNLKPQQGDIAFTLRSTDGSSYRFTVKVIIEEVYAAASESAHYGSVYETIAVENKTPITPTSSYTAQFTTMYCPGAYPEPVESYLSTNIEKDIHGENQDNSHKFPAGTRITMVDITTPSKVSYYYYQCDGNEKDTVPLSAFKNLSSGAAYKNPTGNTVIVEDLLFILDYAQADQKKGTTYLTLEHLYGSGQGTSKKQKDILCYTTLDESGKPVDHYSNLWNDYVIADTKGNPSYVTASLSNPDGAGTTAVKTGRTDNFMYDTYTTKLNVKTAADFIDTAYDGRNLTLAIWLGERFDSGEFPNRTLPLGSTVTVRKADGSAALPARYCQVGNEAGGPVGYYMVDLGVVASGEYTIEVRVSRYLDYGSLFNAFSATTNTHNYTLHADVHSSADGLYFAEDGARIAGGEPAASASADFREAEEQYPVYDLSLDGSTSLLSYQPVSKQVTGTLNTTADTAADVQMTVLRKTSVSDAGVDIAAGNPAAVTRTQKTGSSGATYYQFAIADKPGPGTYLYEIRLGNTVYALQSVTVL